MTYQFQSLDDTFQSIECRIFATGKTLPGLYENLYQNLYHHGFVDNEYLDYMVEDILALYHDAEEVALDAPFLKYILEKYYQKNKKQLLIDLLGDSRDKPRYQVIQTIPTEVLP